MKIKKIKNSDDAVVGIVVTVLLIGLMLSVMVMVNTMYVPQWLENSEAAHMIETSNQFTQLKYALDMQTLVNGSSAMTIPITLGTKDIPFFDRGRTFDTLEIIDNAITIEFSTGKSYTSDAIKFSSGNSYFVDQSYIYEAGALIISQDEKSIVYGIPPIIVANYSDNITFYITEINGLKGKTDASGYGTYPIFTRVNDTTKINTLNDVSHITITTDYPDAWIMAFEQTIQKADGFSFTTTPPDPINEVTFTFIEIAPNFKLPNFIIHRATINTQIAFGLAE